MKGQEVLIERHPVCWHITGTKDGGMFVTIGYAPLEDDAERLVSASMATGKWLMVVAHVQGRIVGTMVEQPSV
jgi:hypothetical protein